MRRHKNLFEKIPQFDNLLLAFHKAQKGKRARWDVIEYRYGLHVNLHRLQQQILSGEPDIGHYRFFMVRDPKPREICAASFAERVLHHAIMNVCEPPLERYAVFDSYACRKEKGSVKAVQRAQYFIRRYGWYLKLDIRKYFDSIDHQQLMTLLARVFAEQKLLDLFSQLLATYHIAPGRGMPIGNLISQHLANFYLGRMDHWLKDNLGLKGYLRYMDDFLIFGDDKATLRSLLACVSDFLAEELGLRLKENIQLNRSHFGVPFLGYRIYPQAIRLTARSKKRLYCRFRLYEQLYLDGEWGDDVLARHAEPLFAFARLADTYGLRSSIMAERGAIS